MLANLGSAPGSSAAVYRRLIGLELFKLRRRPMPWVLVAVLGAISFGLPILFYVTLRLSTTESGGVSDAQRRDLIERTVLPGALTASVENAVSFGAPLLIVLAATAFGGEFAWGTVRLLLARGIGRTRFVVAKLIAVAVWWLAMLTTGTLAALLAAVVIGLFAGQPGLATVQAGDLGGLVVRLLGTWAATVVYGAVAALLAVTFRSTAFGLAAGLFAFYGDAVLSGIALSAGLPPLEWLYRAGINCNVRSLTGGLNGDENPLPLAIFAVVVYLAGAIVGAVRHLRRHDVVIAGVG